MTISGVGSFCSFALHAFQKSKDLICKSNGLGLARIYFQKDILVEGPKFISLYVFYVFGKGDFFLRDGGHISFSPLLWYRNFLQLCAYPRSHDWYPKCLPPQAFNIISVSVLVMQEKLASHSNMSLATFIHRRQFSSLHFLYDVLTRHWLIICEMIWKAIVMAQQRNWIEIGKATIWTLISYS